MKKSGAPFSVLSIHFACIDPQLTLLPPSKVIIPAYKTAQSYPNENRRDVSLQRAPALVLLGRCFDFRGKRGGSYSHSPHEQQHEVERRVVVNCLEYVVWWIFILDFPLPLNL